MRKYQKGRRISPRRKLVLPVRIAGTDYSGKQFEGMAYTLDVSCTGALVAGIRRLLKTDSLVDLCRLDRKVRCRVVRVNPVPGKTDEFHVGLACIEEAKDIWEVEEFDPTFDDYYPSSAPMLALCDFLKLLDAERSNDNAASLTAASPASPKS